MVYDGFARVSAYLIGVAAIFSEALCSTYSVWNGTTVVAPLAWGQHAPAGYIPALQRQPALLRTLLTHWLIPSVPGTRYVPSDFTGTIPDSRHHSTGTIEGPLLSTDKA